MPNLNEIKPEDASGKNADLFAAAGKKLGMVPNILRLLANSPAALRGYMDFSGALSEGELSAGDRERIALAVSELNGCDYCLAAHSAIAHTVGLSDEEIQDSRRASSPDRRTDALLTFVGKLVENRADVSKADVDEFRDAGHSDAAVAEVVANVALSIYTNYFNHVAGTDIDFPVAAPLKNHN